MEICPVCKRKSSTVGKKSLRDKSKPPETLKSEATREIVMCAECLNSYIKGELIVDADGHQGAV